MTSRLLVQSVLLVSLGALGCSSNEDGAAPPASGGTGGGGGGQAGSGGAPGGEGGGGSGGVAGTSGSGGTAGKDAGPDADASLDAPEDVADVATDPLVDAPPHPSPTDPMAIVLYGEMDGLDMTDTYATISGTDVCGPGFDVTRENTAADSAAVRWLDETVNLNPVVGTTDQGGFFSFTLSRYIKVDGATKLLTFRAGQLATGSELTGEVKSEDLDASGSFDSFFHVTKMQRFVDADEGIKDGDLYIWVSGDCKP